MNIRINDVPIQFELEHEENAGEVFDGVNRWLQSAGHRLEELRLNGTLVQDCDDTWRSTPLPAVSDLDFVARSIREKQVEAYDTIINYCQLLERVLREGTEEQRSAVLEELPHVSEGLSRNAPDLRGYLDEPLADADLSDPGARLRAGRRAAEIATILESRQREILDPEHEMRGTIAALDAILPTFAEIPGEIQSGERHHAMEIIARFSELVSRELRILPILVETRPDLESTQVENTPLNEALQALNALFGEMEAAITGGDFVLIGDLLEYEMLPRFTALHAALNLFLAQPSAAPGQNEPNLS